MTNLSDKATWLIRPFCSGRRGGRMSQGLLYIIIGRVGVFYLAGYLNEGDADGL